ncbi:MAG: RNA methyltransferase [Burkholderiales bacterium]|nr:RNA methyltransferase [Burkholderiales bacterium]
MKRIQSRENAWFKSLVKLSASARERRLRGRAILDGPHLIEAWRAGGGVAEAIVASETGSSRPEVRALLESAAAETRVLLPDRLFDALAQVVTPVGILAVIATPAPASVPEEIGDAILLEGLQDAGNLGSILRTAAAAAIARIFLSPGSAFAWSPKVLRAGMGAHFALSIHENVPLETLARRCRGRLIATDAHGGRPLDAVDLTGPVAWIFGNEGAGISPGLASVATDRLHVPMPGMAESLNVAAAAAICLFEQVRQRRARRPG